MATTYPSLVTGLNDTPFTRWEILRGAGEQKILKTGLIKILTATKRNLPFRQPQVTAENDPKGDRRKRENWVQR